eukprot:TRINITY_DN2795_c0_g3_i2.p2 TRINITY_DN2795_c0_g3~~TRINITY_DN2795_c0_g3_i2.p2  ORF type:complete len:183 (-),score=23.32 TRINITY_DN2795_c0_g3_i2:1154-1630(-)
MEHINNTKYDIPEGVEMFERTFENSVNIALRYFGELAMNPSMTNDLPLYSYARVTDSIFAFWSSSYLFLSDLHLTLLRYASIAPAVYEMDSNNCWNRLYMGEDALSIEEDGIVTLACCIARDDKVCGLHVLDKFSRLFPLALQKNGRTETRVPHTHPR